MTRVLPRMRVRQTAIISADPATVWPFLADPVLQAEWNPKVVSIGRDRSGVVRRGERFEMVYRMSGRDRETRVDVMVAQPSERVVFRHRVAGTSPEQIVEESYEVSPHEDGVTVIQTIDLTGAGIPWPFRLLIRFINRSGWDAEEPYLDRLKRRVEQRAPAGLPPLGRTAASHSFGEDMADIALNEPPAEPKRRLSSAVTLLPPLLFVTAAMMASGITAIDLMPLRVLQIPYPKAMDYMHFIIPASCALIWIATVRRWPNTSSIVCVVLCVVLIERIQAYAEGQVARLPVTRWLETEEAKSFESRNGFRIVQRGSKEGLFVIVAPRNAARARAELSTLGLSRSW